MRAVVSLGSAIALSLGLATPALATNQALMINGIGGGAALPDIVMSGVLGGMFADYDRRNVDWPQQARPIVGWRYTLAESVALGADNLDAAIRQALTQIGPGEHVTVVGLSAGSLVADEEMRRLAADPHPIDPSLLSFVVVGDSSRIALNKNRLDPFLNYTYTAPADSPYDTLTLAAQYDGFADFPDRLNNLLAVANAIAGEMVSHVASIFTDLTTLPSGTATVTTNALGGVTTQYLIAPAHLPLVQVMPLLGLFGESGLKSIIDSAYLRNDPPIAQSSTNAGAATAMPAASAVGGPATGDGGVLSAVRDGGVLSAVGDGGVLSAVGDGGVLSATGGGGVLPAVGAVDSGALSGVTAEPEPADAHTPVAAPESPGVMHRGGRGGGASGPGAKPAGGQAAAGADPSAPRNVRGPRAS